MKKTARRKNVLLQSDITVGQEVYFSCPFYSKNSILF